jgi:hypothetical protein
MNPILYQLAHPWHWLLYGNNASALAALSAVLGVIGLFLYVRYTKTIMEATLASFEASFYPVLMAQLSDTSQHFIHWRIHNVGRGPARNVRIWRIEEGNDAPELFKMRQYLPDNERAIVYGTLLPDHDKTEAFEIRYGYATGEDAFLVIVDAEDNAGSAHQLQILSYGKDSSMGHLYHEAYSIPVERKGNSKRRRNTRRFMHGKGESVNVDLNLTNIDGTPYVTPKGFKSQN